MEVNIFDKHIEIRNKAINLNRFLSKHLYIINAVLNLDFLGQKLKNKLFTLCSDWKKGKKLLTETPHGKRALYTN